MGTMSIYWICNFGAGGWGFLGGPSDDLRMKRPASKAKASPETPCGPAPWQSIRKARVARAKALVKDKNYPSKEVLKSMAELLAKHLDGR